MMIGYRTLLNDGCNYVDDDMLNDEFLEKELGIPTCVSYLPDRLSRPLSLHRLQEIRKGFLTPLPNIAQDLQEDAWNDGNGYGFKAGE